MFFRLTGFLIPVWTHHHDVSTRLKDRIINNKRAEESVIAASFYPLTLLTHESNIEGTRVEDTLAKSVLSELVSLLADWNCEVKFFSV